ncbi:MAG: serine hydrolase [Eubacteriales bacterium]|nr:serine hydrolase [Eubacteriales bacterium]
MNQIEETLKKFVDKQEIAGAAVLVRKDGELVVDFAYGYADIEKRIPVSKKTMFRMASMTKPITAIAVMQLVEQGRIGLYDAVETYIPAFSDMRVCAEKVGMDVYVPDPDSPTGQRAKDEVLEAMTYEKAARPITIFDLLNHSSGLGMGPVGDTLAERVMERSDSLLERAVKYASLPLDFQPGTASGYSAVAAFEVLAAVVEQVSGERFLDYLNAHIFGPMGISDITFELNDEQKSRVPRLYEYVDGGLADVTESSVSWKQVNPLNGGHHSGAAGILGTIADYEKIARMLLDKGTYEGVQILKPETVEQMAGKGISHESVMIPGIFWGLGMSVMDEPGKISSSREPGSFGWSGAFGTHFYVDPVHKLDVVLGVNRSNIGGAGSYVSFAVEDAVKEMFYPSYDRFYPGKVWLDTEGKRIQAHGGSVLYLDGTYYWYGENKEKTDGKNGIWHWGVRCYSSVDLYNWKDEGLIIPPEPENPKSPLYPKNCMDRPHILYNKRTGKFVCWLKHMNEDGTQSETVLTAERVLGPYTVVREGLRPMGMDAGDFDLATGADGKAYYFFDRVHSEMICADLTEDYTDVTGYYSTHFPGRKPPFTREGIAHFERKGKHYVFSSGTTGYLPNPSIAAVADTWHGPYDEQWDPYVDDPSNTSFHSQFSCIFKVEGKKDLYIACADRWLPDCMEQDYVEYGKLFAMIFDPDSEKEELARLAKKYPTDRERNTSKADYVWLPLRFEGERAYLDWHEEWKIEDYE